MFNVLDRKLNPHQNGFLEASAGTGKTFTIVTLCLRLILNGMLLNEILIVTFTKLATFEIKKRLREALLNAILTLEKKESAPDYLQAIIEEGESAIQRAQKRLQRALDIFDDAKIFTIHSFCFKSLQEHALDSHSSLEQKEEASPELAIEIVKDYLRFHSPLHPKQMERLLRLYGYDLNALIQEIVLTCEKRVPIDVTRTFDLISKEFSEKLEALSPLEFEPLFSDLMFHATRFEKMADRKGELKPEVIKALRECALQLVEKKTFPFDSILLKMQTANLLKRAPPLEKLHYPHLFEEIQRQLLPLIIEAHDELTLFGTLCSHALEAIKKVVHQEELYFFEDILLLMEKRVQESPDFAQKLSAKYKAVFVDEFQDTDRTQWSILSRLFLEKNTKSVLYLIGDPKQSIYRFRKADLYTYFAAKSQFKENEVHTLNVNFRSSGSLINAMNALFTPVKEFLTLPKNKISFPAKPVLAPSLENDVQPSLYFCIAEDEESLFETVIDEIKKLSPETHKAALVRDRHQERRFCKMCEERSVEVAPVRSRLLKNSIALPALQELLRATLHPKESNLITTALLGPLFSGISFERTHFLEAHEIWMEKGLLACFKHLLAYEDVLKNLINSPWGMEFYSDLLQLVEILIEAAPSPAETLPLLAKLKTKEIEGRFCGKEGATEILTIHSSKGLEYDVVFPIGLILEHQERKQLVYDDETHHLKFNEESFERHLEEVEAEKMRLLYVAMTRAKKKLYLPILEKNKKSAMHLFLQKLLQGEDLLTFVGRHKEMQIIKCGKTNSASQRVSPLLPKLLPPKPLNLTLPSRKMASFSSLKEGESEIETFIHDTKLPYGKEFGNFIHLLLEKLTPLTPKELENTPYLPWKEEICKMIFNALHTKLPVKKPFAIIDIDPNRALKEMEFLYQTEEGTLMKGFIDLFFEHEGTYYLIDWKTNDLGGDYSEKALKAAMEQNQYLLQKQIYEEALRRYLKISHGKKIEIVTLYIFLRGLENNQGVYVVN